MNTDGNDKLFNKQSKAGKNHPDNPGGIGSHYLALI
jgi:hypothetical protein